MIKILKECVKKINEKQQENYNKNNLLARR